MKSGVSWKPLYRGGKWNDIFLLPANALKLWLFHYSHEENGQSYPTEEQIIKGCDMNRDTLYKWRVWLVDHEWLEQLDYAKSREIAGMFVAPSFRVKHGILPAKEGDKRQFNRVRKNRTPSEKIVPQIEVSGSGSDSAFDSSSVRITTGVEVEARRFADAVASLESQKQTSKAKTKTQNQNQHRGGFTPSPPTGLCPDPLGGLLVPQTPTGGLSFATKAPDSARPPRTGKDGTPYPDDFDEWYNWARLDWLNRHDPEWMARQRKESPCPGLNGKFCGGYAEYPQSETLYCRACCESYWWDEDDLRDVIAMHERMIKPQKPKVRAAAVLSIEDE